ncbi:MAG: molybdopterin-dependent oxidoreductase [Chloroflexi bacterium]|nr:molybdopterin-dependent oxidoreductase [Chloroflexota bacterium]
MADASKTESISLQVNGETRQLDGNPRAPLLYALRNDLGLKSPKHGCGTELCGACKVLIDGVDLPSCQLPVAHAAGLEITTVEGLAEGDALHPLQEAFLEEQAGQCGFCTAGLIIAAQGLLNRVRYPSDDDIRAALSNNLCRCGVYDRARRAIRLRVGRPDPGPIYEVVQPAPMEGAGHLRATSPSRDAHPQLDVWIRFNLDQSVTVFSGKVELGQGIKTALAQIAADELDVALERIQVVTADTERSPDEGGTTGSRSLESSGVAVRLAAADARHHLLSLAFEQLDSRTPAEDLSVADGLITDSETGRSTSYWDLMAGRRFNRRISRAAQPKAPADYAVVGKSARRLDLLSKITGGESYVHDMEMPAMLHARVLRPPGYHARLIEFNHDAARQLPGVLAVIHDGQFIAIAAEREENAAAALDSARDLAAWAQYAELPPSAEIYRALRQKPAQSNLIVDGAAVNDPIPPIQDPAGAAVSLEATYRRPFQMHASLGPSAALALWEAGQLTVWSHTQAAFTLRGALAQVLSLDEAQVRVIHVEGAGCYGHNGADDVALDAALVARALPGRPVLLKWTRWDEHAWEPYGTAMLMQLRASLSAAGDIVDWNYDVWSYAHSTRSRVGLETSGLLAAWHLEAPFAPQEPGPMLGHESGAHRNANPIYAFPQKRVARHGLSGSPLRVSALRSLGAYANVFAIESFMDELALAAKADPLAFRLRHLEDERARALLTAAAEKVDWLSGRDARAAGEGWGMALAQYKNLQCYCAVMVKLRVDVETGEVRFERVVIAADAGQTVNPDGLSNQLEGGFVQAASWTLNEEVTFDARGITSVDWESYPILSFASAPKIETLILNRPEMPMLGAGEAAQNPTPAAIANAIFDATGLRLRDIPFTPEKILAGLSEMSA